MGEVKNFFLIQLKITSGHKKRRLESPLKNSDFTHFIFLIDLNLFHFLHITKQ